MNKRYHAGHGDCTGTRTEDTENLYGNRALPFVRDLRDSVFDRM
jgi:hypothetical protein